MNWYNNNTEVFMNRGYLKPNQTIQEKIKEIADFAEKIMKKEGLAERIIHHITLGNYVIATPTWKNFYEGSKYSGISCFGLEMDDTIDSILSSVSEAGMQSKIGGGTSGYFNNLRERGARVSAGGTSGGPIHFMELFQTNANVIAQTNRRGHFSATLSITHPDIMEFLELRKEGCPIQDLSYSVSIPDKWMTEMLEGNEEYAKIWAKIIENRFHTGFPYIFFVDNVNNNAPEVYKETGRVIKFSNMCMEIALNTSDEESFVCDLIGMNLERFDEWKDTDAVEIALYLLDAQLQDFIQKYDGHPFLQKAVNFAKNQMAVGIGASGYHSYLQSKMIPFESMEAKMINAKIFKLIHEQSLKASQKMAKEYGKALILKDEKYTYRHALRNAIAPNTSSAFILGQQSQSIEPYVSNYYVKDVAKDKKTIKNPYLKKHLREIGKDTEEVWMSILKNGGSVQHLDFLDAKIKLVFKTFGEISQKEIIIQASARQKFVDQSQSLNIMVPEGTNPDDVSYLMLLAWRLKIKTLYYQLNVSAAQSFTNKITECESCSG